MSSCYARAGSERAHTRTRITVYRQTADNPGAFTCDLVQATHLCDTPRAQMTPDSERGGARCAVIDRAEVRGRGRPRAAALPACALASARVERQECSLHAHRVICLALWRCD
eukprot:Tamp_33243.p1 GENE.Tamp_33243~~Tamp_33243.p1  ORF type:complete len:112 (-),score=6.01 Tamp_33243:66-401(-)